MIFKSYLEIQYVVIGKLNLIFSTVGRSAESKTILRNGPFPESFLNHFTIISYVFVQWCGSVIRLSLSWLDVIR
jgi:hypothetical protein